MQHKPISSKLPRASPTCRTASYTRKKKKRKEKKRKEERKEKEEKTSHRLYGPAADDVLKTSPATSKAETVCEIVQWFVVKLPAGKDWLVKNDAAATKKATFRVVAICSWGDGVAVRVGGWGKKE